MFEIATLKVEVLNFESQNTALSGTTNSNITINNHGRSVGDFILNSSLSATSQGSSERGSRKIVTIVDSNNFTVSQVVGQTSGNVIYFYEWVEITNYIEFGTFSLNLKTQGEATSQFNIIQNYTVGVGFDIELLEGKLIKISFDSTVVAMQIIDRIHKSEKVKKGNTFTLSINMRDLKAIASRRNVSIDYDESNYTTNAITSPGTSIVADMVDILGDEGIEPGTFENGVLLGKDWKNGAISISQVLNECANKNGMQWYINEDMELDFLIEQSSIPNAPFDIVDGGTFTDYDNLETDGSLSGYINKVTCIGNDDGYGNQINFTKSLLSDQKTIQKENWGSGVYGDILQNTNDNEVDEYDTSVGTSSTNLNIVSHPFEIGDYVYNVDRESGTYVTAIVDVNNVTVESVSGQLPGDLILFFIGAKNKADEILNRNRTNFTESPIPKIITFETKETITFRPGQKLKFQLAKYGVSTNLYFNIESVTIFNYGNKEKFGSKITAVQRDNSNFSTHKRYNGNDFFKNNF